MMQWMRISLLGLVAVLVAAPAFAAEFLPGGKGRVLGQYVVVLHDRAVPTKVAADHGVAPALTFNHALRGFAASLPEAALKRLLNDPRVKYVEPDGVVRAIRVVPTGPGNGNGPNKEEGGTASGQQTPWGITRVGGPLDGSGKRAWVIDTGIDFEHADLDVDKALSANFVTRGKNSADDGNGHGTHVAGTIAALNNSIDVVGVAAGAKLVAVRVLDNSGSGMISWVIAGIDYVTANASAGEVGNLSLGAQGHFQSLHDALTGSADKGILYAVAAGNDGEDASGSEPAHVEHGGVFTVSAIENGDCFAWFSNYGNPPVDFAAPGVDVLSTKNGGGTHSLNGTSMAAPHVAGLLLMGGPIADGFACNDPDANPDSIAHH